MKKRAFEICVIVSLATVFLVLSPGLWAKVSFRCRMYSTVAGAPPINVKIDINEYSSPEETQRLSQAFITNDENGFYAALRSLNKGSIQFVGGLGLNIKLNAAWEQKTENGLKVFLMTESRSVEPGATRMKNLTWRFLVIVLDLDKNYEGEGKIYEDASISVSQEGNFAVDSSFSVPKTVVSVRLVK